MINNRKNHKICNSKNPERDFYGSGGGDRTHDLGVMSAMLCQLSYPASPSGAPVRIRTQNTWSEAKRDIHFTTGAFQQ